jgi:integrase
VKLDAKTIAALKLGDRTDLIVFDDQLPGFGFRLRQGSGGKLLKSFIAQYRHAGATRRVLLGSAGKVTPEQARQAAKKLLAKVALGDDPQADKVERRDKDRMTVRAVIAEYLTVKAKQVRPKTMTEIVRYLTNPGYFGLLHRLPIDKVSRKDVASALLAISRTRGNTTATLARTALSAFFTWSMQMGLTEANPVIGTARYEVKPRARVLTDAELAKIWKASGTDDFGKIVKLLILTAARRTEVGGMAWSEIDSIDSTWTIAASRSKNGRAHTLPLMPGMIELIAGTPRMVDRDQLFGLRYAAGFSQWSEAKDELDQRLDIAEPWTLHDLRRSAATRMADLGIAPHVIEQILNHQSGHKSGVAGIYNRSSYEREVRAALALWEDHIRTLIVGGKRKVVALRTK